MTVDKSLLLVEYVGKKNNIALITLNRQEALNAFNDQMLDELSTILKTLKVNTNIRVVIIYAEGKSWSAGVDLKWVQSLGVRIMKAIRKGQNVFTQIERLPQPVIAAINGYALGGGMELALACDLRIAADKALFGLTETTIGLFPGWGGTFRLPRLVGEGIAKDLIYTGRKILADVALEMGLINDKVPLEELKARSIEIAEVIAENAPIGLKGAKRAIYFTRGDHLYTGYAYEQNGLRKCFRSKDIREGIEAVFQKRKPEFKGE
jgi:enoyl-CoA hydratase/carnithine racemase